LLNKQLISEINQIIEIMSNSEIISICQALKSEGKEPSIALIKSRMSKNTPMPFLISGLQQWRANPDIKLTLTEKETTTETEKQTLEQRIEALEQEVAYLKTLNNK